jgi:hypothetical protein
LDRNCITVRIDAPSLLFQALLARSGVSGVRAPGIE